MKRFLFILLGLVLLCNSCNDEVSANRDAFCDKWVGYFIVSTFDGNGKANQLEPKFGTITINKGEKNDELLLETALLSNDLYFFYETVPAKVDGDDFDTTYRFKWLFYGMKKTYEAHYTGQITSTNHLKFQIDVSLADREESDFPQFRYYGTFARY